MPTPEFLTAEVLELPTRIVEFPIPAPSGVDSTSAHVCLSRLCGCNYRMPVTRRGAFVYVVRPQDEDGSWRIPAALFDAGQRTFRDGWIIRRWDAEAERITESEKGWQT